MQILPMIFIGEDGSLGYKHGYLYTVCVMATLEQILVYTRENPNGVCPYEDVNKFFENWALPE